MNRIVAIFLLVLGTSTQAAAVDDLSASFERQMGALSADSLGEREKLGDQYLGALKNALKKAQQSGDLDNTLAFKAEIARFQEAGDVPANSPKVAMIARWQGVYLRNLADINLDESRKVIALVKRYDTALERLERRMVAAGQVEQALTVRAKREQAKQSDRVSKAMSLIRNAPAASAALRVVPESPNVKATVGQLAAGKRVANNRAYTFGKIPKELQGLNVLVMECGKNGNYQLSVSRDTRLHLLVVMSQGVDGNDLVRDGWRRTPHQLQIMVANRPSNDPIVVYEKFVPKGAYTIESKGSWAYALASKLSIVIGTP